MFEQKQNDENKNLGLTKKITKWARYIVLTLSIVLLLTGLLWKAGLLNYSSVDERLAAIEAVRAIPDEENAAVIYNQLLQNYDESSLSFNFLDVKTEELTLCQPWSSEDYPELAKQLTNQHATISKLLEASKNEKCQFPISRNHQDISNHLDIMIAMRKWTFLLVRAANNDIGEGRIDAGIEKYLCIKNMAKHLRQQLCWIDYLVGIAIEAVALKGMAQLIVESNLTERHLEIIEAAYLSTKNNWSKDLAAILEVERLFVKKNSNFYYQLRCFWKNPQEESIDKKQEIYLRLLADRRGNRILVALRRYKNKNGRWPKSLDDVGNTTTEEILVDPINNSSFIYELMNEGFMLYSKGKNNIDDGGSRDMTYSKKTGADDWLIWPKKLN